MSNKKLKMTLQAKDAVDRYMSKAISRVYEIFRNGFHKEDLVIRECRRAWESGYFYARQEENRHNPHFDYLMQMQRKWGFVVDGGSSCGVYNTVVLAPDHVTDVFREESSDGAGQWKRAAEAVGRYLDEHGMK